MLSKRHIFGRVYACFVGVGDPRQHRQTPPRPASSRRLRVALAMLTTSAMGGAFLAGPAAGVAAGASTTPTIIFQAPTTSGFSTTLTYTVNRGPQQFASLACSLAPSGGAATTASCGAVTRSSKGSTTRGVTLPARTVGTYTYTVTVRLTDGGRATKSTMFTVAPVRAACTVSAYSVTFSGSAHTATGSCTGVGGIDLSLGLNLSGTTHTNAGSYSDTWTFTDVAGQYTNPGGTLSDVILPAKAQCTVTPYSVTYDGAAHTAAGSCTGIGGVDLSAGLDLRATTHTKAGNYTDAWTFTDSSGNHTNPGGTLSDSIAKAAAQCTVTSYAVTYDGAPHTAAGSCAGIGGVDLSAGLDLRATTHTKAGNYTDAWTFTDAAGNYAADGGTLNDSIAQATARCTVTSYSVTYDGAAHSAIGSCTGVGGVDLSAGLDLRATGHTTAGNYTDMWTFTDPDGNYTNPGGTVSNSIGKATAECSVTSYSLTYDAKAHTATGSCTGVGGVDLSAGLDLSGTTHTDAGSYLDTWTFADPNHTNPGGAISNTVGQAAPECSVTGYTLTYDGAAHSATGGCTGVGDADLSAGLDLGATIHTNAGSYSDAWSFTDAAGNYSTASGTVDASIAQAVADCTVTGYSVSYDAAAHSAAGSCTGVGSVDLSGLDLTATAHTVAGTYTDGWTFSNANYSNPGGTVTSTITKAAADCTVTGYSVTFDDAAHTATGSCTGIGGVDLSAGLDLAGTTHTAAGTFTDSWTFTDANHSNPGGTVTDTITMGARTPVQCSISPYTVTYDGKAHTSKGWCATPDWYYQVGLDLSGTTHTNAGVYTDSWTFNYPLGVYSNPGGIVINTINKAQAYCSVTGYTVAFDGNAHTATGSCTGFDGTVDLSAALVLSGTTHTAAGTYTSTWSFDHPNFSHAGGTLTTTIDKGTATCSIAGYNAAADGAPHTATGSCMGVDGEDLSAGLNLTGTTHTTAGIYNADAWSFTDPSGNYADLRGTVVDTIGQPAAAKTATCTVTGYRVTYDGAAHTAAGTCTGVNGEDLSHLLNVGGTTHTQAGAYVDNWTFTDPTGEYANAGGAVTDIIGKATAVCTVTGYNNYYYVNFQYPSTGTCIGIDGADLSAGLNLIDPVKHGVGVHVSPWSFNTGNLYPNYFPVTGQVTATYRAYTGGGGGGGALS